MAVRIESQQEDRQTIVISKDLADMIEAFAASYISSGELIQKIVEQAEKENIPKEKLREIIEEALKKRQLSDRQIRRAMPAALKRSYHRTTTVTAIRQTIPNQNNSDMMTDSIPTDYVNLPRKLFQQTAEAIQRALESNADSIVLRFNSHEILSVGDLQTIEVS